MKRKEKNIMKRKINLRMLILTSVFAFILLLLGTTKAQAVLQANPTTHKSPVAYVGSTWLTAIRQMETIGQTMGLTEVLDGLEATSESKNNIDVHMMLPTEYGAVAILSASGYGNPGKLQDESDAQKRTTTGNATGVYFTGDRWEMNAGYTYGTQSKYFQCITDDQKVLLGSLGWHSGGSLTHATANIYSWGMDRYRAAHLTLLGGRGIFSIHDVHEQYECPTVNVWTGTGGDFMPGYYPAYCSRGVATV